MNSIQNVMNSIYSLVSYLLKKKFIWKIWFLSTQSGFFMNLIGKFKKKRRGNVFYLVHICLWLVNAILWKMASRWSVKSFLAVTRGQYSAHPCPWAQGCSWQGGSDGSNTGCQESWRLTYHKCSSVLKHLLGSLGQAPHFIAHVEYQGTPLPFRSSQHSGDSQTDINTLIGGTVGALLRGS